MRLVPPVAMIGWDCRVLPPATAVTLLNVATVSTEPVPMTTRLPPWRVMGAEAGIRVGSETADGFRPKLSQLRAP